MSIEGETVVIDGVRFSREAEMTVIGPVKTTDSFEMRFSSGFASLAGMRINGRGSQDEVAFHLVQSESDGKPSVTEGKWYEVKGRWVDGKIFGVNKILTFAASTIRPVDPAPLRLADFVDRPCHFEGAAARGGKISVGSDEAALGLAQWPPEAQGKLVEVQGTLRKTDSGWRFENPVWHLVRLEDQIGRDVSLEGSLWSLNGVWWFNYRDQKLYLTGEKGPALDFPTETHGRPACVSGKLVRQLRPSLDQISLKQDKDLVPTFVIRGAKVEFPGPTEAPEDRFRAVYANPVVLKEGVPVLLAEPSYRMNIMGDETEARLFHERNDTAIRAFLKAPTPAQIEVLAARLKDAEKSAALRLLYAALLATCNDARGRTVLLEALKDPESPSFPDALYCTGAVQFLPPDGSALKPETAWAEEALIRILADRTPRGDGPADPLDEVVPDPARMSPAHAAAHYSSVIELLLQSRSEKGRAAVLDLALSGSGGSGNAIRRLCESPEPLPLDALKNLAAVPTADDEYGRRRVLDKFLMQNEPTAVELFREEMADGFVYMDFRKAMTPELAAALVADLPNLSGEALIHARMLLALSAKDPAKEVISLLNDPKWTDKSLAAWELERLKDPRALDPLVHALRGAPKGFFKSDSTFGSATGITNALDAVAAIGSKQAIDALIGFLNAPFGRAKEDYMNDAGIHRIIAAHLIELTGECFGVDAEAWRKWFQSQR